MARNSIMPLSKVWLTEPIFTKLTCSTTLCNKKKVYREFHESLTNDLVTDTGSKADTGTLLSDTIPNCREQKNLWCFFCDPLQLSHAVWSGTFKPTVQTSSSACQVCLSVPVVTIWCQLQTSLCVVQYVAGHPASHILSTWVKWLTAWSWSLAST